MICTLFLFFLLFHVGTDFNIFTGNIASIFSLDSSPTNIILFIQYFD